MNRIEKIINRLNIWMNTDSEGNHLNKYDEFNSIFEHNNINVYHLYSKRRVAVISLKLEFRILDLTHSTEQEEYDNFILKQYINSLLYRILSTI